jgi:hypothetical protein
MTLGSSSWVLGRFFGTRRRCWFGAEPSFVLQPSMLRFASPPCFIRLSIATSTCDINMRRQRGQAPRTTPRRIGNQSFLVHTPERAQVDVEGGLGLLGFFCPFAVVSPVPSVPVPCAFLSRPLFSSSPLPLSPPLLSALSFFLLFVYGRYLQYRLLHGSYMRGRLLSRPNSPLLALPPAA